MGSMAKVMEKLTEEPPRAPAAAGAPPATVPTPSAVADEEPGIDPGAPGQELESGFVADSRAGTGAASERRALEPTTANWDPQQVDAVVVAFHDRYSAICEQYRSVRARLLTMNAERAPQVIAVTSAIPEEGKSVSTVNLGLVMAEGGEHRILITDADFRRTSLARMLGVSDRPGLAEILRGETSLAQALQATPFPNLKFLPAGKMRDNTYGDLLGGPGVKAFIDELHQTFDYAFLDTPPITTVSDVCLLAPLCDGAIIVIQMRRTPEPTVQQGIRALQANNVKILGAILSRFRERGAGYYYDHYYSYYYR